MTRQSNNKNEDADPIQQSPSIVKEKQHNFIESETKNPSQSQDESQKKQ